MEKSSRLSDCRLGVIGMLRISPELTLGFDLTAIVGSRSRFRFFFF